MRFLSATNIDTLYGQVLVVADASTITFDCAKANTNLVTLGGNRTLAVTNDQDGEIFNIILKQDATGSRTVTWFSGIVWAGLAPILTIVPGGYDIFRILRLGSGSYLWLPSVVSETVYNDNLLTNGNFDIWQRGTSLSTVLYPVVTADRWRHIRSGTMVHTNSKSAITAPPSTATTPRSSYTFRVACTTAQVSLLAGDFCGNEYAMEGTDFNPIFGRTFTLSFWVFATKVGVYCVAFRNSANDRSYVAEYNVTSAGVWQRKVITVSHNTTGTWLTDNNVGMRIAFMLAAGTTYQVAANTWSASNSLTTSNQVNACDSTSNVFILSQIKLEVGSVATYFQPNLTSRELADCQRYYQSSNGFKSFFAGNVTSGVTYYTNVYFNTIMRTVPTVILTNANSAGFPAVSANSYPTLAGFTEDRLCNATTNGGLYGSTWTADAEL